MNSLDRHQGKVVSLFRIVVGLLFACHGASKLLGFPSSGMSGHAPELFSFPGWWAAIIELVGGLLVLVGLATRTAAVICSGAMAYAYFSVHQSTGTWPIQNKGEAAALYSWAFLLIAFIGPGEWALSRFLGKQEERQRVPARG
ncbi:DoxX family protein [Pseudonocardiaceae bacterium YIM PH 21723]|nr:DoxX family protein [Pseudonocardiaceae bacterium YIM PH 21723]